MSVSMLGAAAQNALPMPAVVNSVLPPKDRAVPKIDRETIMVFRRPMMFASLP